MVLRIFLSLLAATGLAALAAWRRALTLGGLALAWALAAVIAFCGGAGGFVTLTVVFLGTVGAGKLSKQVREPIERNLHAKRGPRDAAQIFCNVFVGAVCLLLYRLTQQELFRWGYAGAMAASLADSMASELGILSKKAPRDILTRQETARGLSGGVTAVGLAASAIGAIWGACFCAAFWARPLLWPCGAAAGFLAALADSVLGSLAQAKYRCAVCGTLTERREHCGTPGRLERGLRFVNNDLVNFCNNLVGAGIAMALSLAMPATVLR